MTSDLELVRQYVDANSQAAFAELVHRYLDLVYSSARRQVGSPDLAKDIAQTVFLKLSNQAAQLKPDTQLGPWLYVVTRHAAVDFVRREQRRRAREGQAEEIAMMHAPESNWSEIEPWLDDAVASLEEDERTAVILRYFAGKSFREVGEACAISDDTAQKRVSRAITHLQEFFIKRGVAIGATSLAGSLSAHAISPAPVGLDAAILTAVPSVLAPATIHATSQIFAMTVFQKTAASLVLAVIAGLSLYQMIEVQRGKQALLDARREATGLRHDLAQLRFEKEQATAALTRTEQQIDARLASQALPASDSDAALQLRLKLWYARIAQLKALLKQRPELGIPELALLTDDAWFDIVKDASLNSEEGARRALANLKDRAMNAMANKLVVALRAYNATHGGVGPDTPGDLARYLDTPPEWLDGYTLLQSEKQVAAMAQGHPTEAGLVLAKKVPADADYDSYWGITTEGSARGGAAAIAFEQAQLAYGRATGGRVATSAEQLEPFLAWPVAAADLDRAFAAQAQAAGSAASPTQARINP